MRTIVAKNDHAVLSMRKRHRELGISLGRKFIVSVVMLDGSDGLFAALHIKDSQHQVGQRGRMIGGHSPCCARAGEVVEAYLLVVADGEADGAEVVIAIGRHCLVGSRLAGGEQGKKSGCKEEEQRGNVPVQAPEGM